MARTCGATRSRCARPFRHDALEPYQVYSESSLWIVPFGLNAWNAKANVTS
jgi:hypothetical protein